jgi:hypothetical protein
MSRIPANLQLDVANVMKIAALNGEIRFIDHANESYWKILPKDRDPLTCADYDRRQARLRAVQLEIIKLQLQSVPLRTDLI